MFSGNNFAIIEPERWRSSNIMGNARCKYSSSSGEGKGREVRCVEEEICVT